MAKTTRKMTAKYWRSLSRESQARALSFVYGFQQGIIDMLLDDNNPRPSDPFWSKVYRQVRIPEAGSWYKTVVNNHTYLM